MPRCEPQICYHRLLSFHCLCCRVHSSITPSVMSLHLIRGEPFFLHTDRQHQLFRPIVLHALHIYHNLTNKTCARSVLPVNTLGYLNNHPIVSQIIFKRRKFIALSSPEELNTCVYLGNHKVNRPSESSVIPLTIE